MLAFFGTILLITRGQRRADAWLRVDRAPRPVGQARRHLALLAKVADRITVLINNRRTLWWAFTWAALNWLLDAACLWVFLWSFGSVVSPIDLLVAYGLANVLAAIPITPAGLGVVEAVLITSLVGFGVPHSQAILAVLAYRLVNFWIPIPLGGASLREPAVAPAGRRQTWDSDRARSIARRLNSACAEKLFTGCSRRQRRSVPSTHVKRSSRHVTSNASRSLAWSGALLDRHEHLDATVEVSLHQVGRTDVERELVLPGLAEDEDARVLEELAHDRVDRDVLREPRHAGTQRAERAHDESNLDASDARLVERVDDRGIRESVHLDRDLAARVRGRAGR